MSWKLRHVLQFLAIRVMLGWWNKKKKKQSLFVMTTVFINKPWNFKEGNLLWWYLVITYGGELLYLQIFS